MNLQHLPRLHASMIEQGLTKTKFDFHFRTLRFSVIYIAESRFPHELLFGCRAHNLFFVVNVSRDYRISTYLNESYGELVRALDLQPDPANPFKPAVFFEAFDEATPTATSPANTPSISDVALLSRDVEEADKVFFFGWLPHDGRKSGPSDANLTKTKRICGVKTYELCLRHHISSRWTDDPNRAVQFHEPTA